MSNFLPKSLRVLIEELSKLPSIGPKSAQRLAMFLLRSPEQRSLALGRAILGLKEGVNFCGECWNLAESDPCSICDNPARDRGMVCVVEEVLDTLAVENTGQFGGVYHVLHGALSPINGVGPEQLKMQALFDRVAGGGVSELILATNPSLEGEATALYIQRGLLEMGSLVKVTRIARGLPVGGDLEYADAITLGRAMKERTKLEN